ncbi:MAG TPA: phosphotransacetylase [Nocardioidaceae bacterium]|nr:phosphotransacetylase [Nocardioidaceae bacterium]
MQDGVRNRAGVRPQGDGAARCAAYLRDQTLRWSTRLSGRPVRVVLTDGDDPRVVEAARWLALNTSVRPVLLSAQPGGDASDDLPREVERWNTATLSTDDELLEALRVRANGKERDPEEAARVAADDVYLGAALVATGRVQACVAGATRPTGDVIRAGLSVIGLAPEVSTVSSSFVLVLPDGRRLAYGDCAVLPTPDEHQLAQVAISTARTYRQLVGEDPVVAMLSFSTMGSAQHPEVETVRAATRLAREQQPTLCVDGEMQFDAAMLESVGNVKAAGSPVAGRANVLVFPNLAAGNIGYKITERLAGAAAVGPILQGLDAPMNDLSRGCSSRDVVAVALLSAVQAVHAETERSGRRQPVEPPAAGF